MEHSEEIKKRMEQMEVRLDQYEQDFRGKKSCFSVAAVSVVSVVLGAEAQQESDLKTLRREFEGLKTLVSTLVSKSRRSKRIWMTRNNTAGQTALLSMESKIFQNGGSI